MGLGCCTSWGTHSLQSLLPLHRAFNTTPWAVSEALRFSLCNSSGRWHACTPRGSYLKQNNIWLDSFINTWHLFKHLHENLGKCEMRCVESGVLCCMPHQKNNVSRRCQDKISLKHPVCMTLSPHLRC